MPAFSTFDAIASATRKEVDAAICEGIHDRMSMPERAGLLRLLEERESDGTTQAARRNTPCRWAGACAGAVTGATSGPVTTERNRHRLPCADACSGVPPAHGFRMTACTTPAVRGS